MARIAWTDPYRLSARRCVDVESTRRGRPTEHVSIGSVNPMCAKIEGRAEYRGISHAAAANTIGCLQQHEAAVGSGKATRGGDARSAGADGHHIHIHTSLSAHECRPGHNGPGGGEERASAQPRHGIQILAG